MLCVSLLFTLFVGCASADDEELINDLVDEPIIETQPNFENDVDFPFDGYDDYGDQLDLGQFDFNAAIATFPPDTVMASAGDLVITWAELYVYLFDTFIRHQEFFSDDPDENDAIADFILEYSTDFAVSFLVYLYGFDSLDLTISDEDLALFNDDIAGMIEMYGGVESLEQNIRETGGYYDFDVFVSIFKNQLHVSLLIDEFFGEESTMFTDEEVAEYASDHDFIMALHILRLATEDGDETPRREAEEILQQLREHDDGDIVDFFIALMHDYSEDFGGLASAPDGYLFQDGDMVSEFYDTSRELEIGEISDIVETDFGYHIILRIPIDYDAIPASISRAGMSLTLRQLVALESFNALEEEWRESLNIEFTPEFYSIDIKAIFGID